ESGELGERDGLGGERVAGVGEEGVNEDRRPVARPAPPAGRISAFALVKRHGFSPCLAAKKYAARGRSASAQQNARRGVPPGRLGVVSVNTLFWKILVTRVKQKMCDASVGSLSCCPNSGFARARHYQWVAVI